MTKKELPIIFLKHYWLTREKEKSLTMYNTRCILIIKNLVFK